MSVHQQELCIIFAGQGQRQPKQVSSRKPSLSSHPVPDSAPGSRRSTRQSDYGGHSGVAPAEGRRSQRGTADHVAYPALPSAQGQRSQPATSDHAAFPVPAYPTIAPTDGRQSRRQTADQPTEGASLPRYAPYPSMASPENLQHSGSYHEHNRRLTQQHSAAGELPTEGRSSRRATEDGTDNRRRSQNGQPLRPSYNGEGPPAQHAAVPGTYERWGTDAAVSVSYPNTGEGLPAPQNSLRQGTGNFLSPTHPQ